MDRVYGSIVAGLPEGSAERPINVLLVHELFPPDFAGGGEYVVGEIAQRLHARGHVVHVLTTGDPSIGEYRGIPTTRLPISRYRMNLAWRWIAGYARDADLVHAFTFHSLYPAMRAARLHGKPLVCGVLAQFGDVWLEMKGVVLGRLWRRLERHLLSLPFDARLYLNDFSHEAARRIGADRPGDQVILPGISHERFTADAEKSYVLFTGKLEARKGIQVVLAAARQLPDIPFRVIGWGPDLDDYVAMAPANVIVEKRQEDSAHYVQALAGARIFLFPSKAETFGLVVPEAMASGCAIVSTLPMPFEGARVSPDDVDGVVAAVRALWDDRVRCAHCGAANRAMTQQYDWDQYATELEQVYRRVIHARQGKLKS